MANELLRELEYPPPPIDPYSIAEIKGWKIGYEDLKGAAGLTYKVKKKSGFRYAIFLDNKAELLFPEDNLLRRNRYTMAHEIGHIILHEQYEWQKVEDPNLENKLEVEANWFASRLLMPDYGFTNEMDLTTSAVMAKFEVNLSAAKKRLDKLDKRIRERLIQDTAILYDWQHEDIEERPLFVFPDDDDPPSSELYMLEAAAMAEANMELHVCEECGDVMVWDWYGFFCISCTLHNT